MKKMTLVEARSALDRAQSKVRTVAKKSEGYVEKFVETAVIGAAGYGLGMLSGMHDEEGGLEIMSVPVEALAAGVGAAGWLALKEGTTSYTAAKGLMAAGVASYAYAAGRKLGKEKEVQELLKKIPGNVDAKLRQKGRLLLDVSTQAAEISEDLKAGAITQDEANKKLVALGIDVAEKK